MKNRKLQRIVGQYRSIQMVYVYIIPFLRSLEEVTAKKHGNCDVFITAQMMKDVEVVEAAVDDADRNQICMYWLLHPRDKGDIEVYTDAATSQGVGGFIDFGPGHGSHFAAMWTDTARWKEPALKPDIVYMELLGVVLAAELYGSRWTGKSVRFWCDNWAVCKILKRKAACFRRRDLNDLVRLNAMRNAGREARDEMALDD